MKRTIKKRSKKRPNKKSWKRRGGMFSAARLSTRIASPHVERKAKEWGQDLIEERLKRTDMYKKVESGLQNTISNVGNSIIISNKENQNNYNNLNHFNTPLSTPNSIFKSGLNQNAKNYALNKSMYL
jgi:hypothetical protein